ncbi:hypothetical protein MMC07_009299 [Pseudocyphellaria aurata]|nr:hypothetical protein [Pseudocyphellaria aurata]
MVNLAAGDGGVINNASLEPRLEAARFPAPESRSRKSKVVVRADVAVVQVDDDFLDGRSVRDACCSARGQNQGLDAQGDGAVQPDGDVDLQDEDPAGGDDDAGVAAARPRDVLEDEVGAEDGQYQQGAELQHQVGKGQDQRVVAEPARPGQGALEHGHQARDEDAHQQHGCAAVRERDSLPDDGHLVAVGPVAGVAHPEHPIVQSGHGYAQQNDFHEACHGQAATQFVRVTLVAVRSAQAVEVPLMFLNVPDDFAQRGENGGKDHHQRDARDEEGGLIHDWPEDSLV